MSKEDERLQEMRQRMQEQRLEAEYRFQRRSDAQQIGAEISDTRIQRPGSILPRIAAFLRISAERVETVTAYEADPIARALLMKAQGGLLEEAQAKVVRGLDADLAALEASNPVLLSAKAKFDAHPEGNGEIPDLTEEEMVAWDGYSRVLLEREAVLDQMTGGVSKLMDEKYSLGKSRMRQEAQRVELDGRKGGLTSDEQDRFDELLALRLGALGIGEIRDFERIFYNDEDVTPAEEAMLNRLQAKIDKAGRLTDDEQREYDGLLGKAGSLRPEERGLLKKLEDQISVIDKRLPIVDKLIEDKIKKLGMDDEWYGLYLAFMGAVSNINVTDQWQRAWHDYGAGAVDTFTQTRWTEFQKISEMLALLERTGQTGKAMEAGFAAMCKIGLGINDRDVPGAKNVFQMKGLTEEDIQNKLVGPCVAYARRQIGAGAEDLYVELGVEMARMLFENALCSGWCMVPRDVNGNIIYGGGTTGRAESSDFDSDAYKYAEVGVIGDGSAYAHRGNDYVKAVAMRLKQMNEFASGYETGLPAMLPVLPDSPSSPWIRHEDMVAIAGGRALADVLRKARDTKGKIVYSESSRWGWMYKLFRQEQLYELVSKFAIGLKGFRSAAEEADFFLKSPSNLGALSKKTDVAFGSDVREGQRFRMNFALALLYSVRTDRANPNITGEMKTVLDRRKSGDDESLISLLINAKKDDIGRMFVFRTNFLTNEQWNLVWSRLAEIYPDEGGKFGVGMIKRGEDLGTVYMKDVEIGAQSVARRSGLTKNV